MRMLRSITGYLRLLIALGFEIDRIERLASGDKEAVFHDAAEAEIGDGLGQVDLADQISKLIGNIVQSVNTPK